MQAATTASAPIPSEIETSLLPHSTGAGSSQHSTAGATSVLDAPHTLARTRNLTTVKGRKGVALIVVGLVIIGLVLLAYFDLRRRNDGAIGSIAVLPFVNQNNDPSTEYLADGIPESIINTLSQVPSLKVMSRNSVFHYKGKETDAQAVAKELHVESVLTGRVAQRGDGLLINVELINTQDNTQIWGQQYNSKLADVFAVQEQIAKDITEKLRVKLASGDRQQLAKRPTDNLKAFQYYIQARALIQRRTREDLLAALNYCEKAISEDRNYALAYTGLADAYDNLGVRGYISPLEGRSKAEEAVRRALALDENLAEAHAVLGEVYMDFAPYDFASADRELRHAAELSPSLAMAYQHLGSLTARQGRFDEALENFLKARELDPLSPIIARQVSLPYYLKGDYVHALELLRQANELGVPLTSTWEIGIYIQNRSFDEALVELEKAKQGRKNDPILIYGTGMIYAAQGKRESALQVIKELEEINGSSLSQAQWIAKIYATLNDKDAALTWLERGLATGVIQGFFKDDPVWAPIRADRRFTDLLRRIGVPQ